MLNLTAIGYSDEFANFMKKYSSEILRQNGISEEQLNLPRFYYSMTGKQSRFADNSVDSNANVASRSSAAIMQEVDKPRQKLFALYCIWNLLREWHPDNLEYANVVIDSILTGLIYPHDLALFVYCHYCYAYSAEEIMKKGLPFIPKLYSKPAQHARSFIAHVNQFIQYASNHQPGAIALPGLWVAYAYFAKKDGLTKKERQQDYQEFIYTSNQPVRYSVQSPFINTSMLDKDYMIGQYGNGKFTYPDGSLPDFEFVDQIQREFYEFFNDTIDSLGHPITFPVQTAAMIKDEQSGLPKDRDFLDWFVKENVRHCSSNILLNYDPNNFASCCRMLNYTDPLKYTNSLGAGGDSIGSWGACTLNLAGIAGEGRKNNKDYEYKDFLKDVEEYAEIARELVRVRRHFVMQAVNRGELPLFSHGFIKPASLYLTVGIVGAYEGLKIMGCFDEKPAEESLTSYTDLLDVLNEGNKKSSDESSNTIYNLEQVPAENAAVKLAALDRLMGRHNYQLLSNQWLPLSYDCDIFTRLETSGALDSAMSGGAIVHITSGSELNEESMKALIDYAAKTENVYFAVNYMFSCCPKCGTISHTADITRCPECGSEELEKFTRVVGFVTPLSTWSSARLAEKRTQLDLSMKPAC
ncbi:MAG: hypothetical protein IJP96_12160 [Synergistaceae bacterium]|nr:hypothetical protein [Synergistaceae bacterium]